MREAFSAEELRRRSSVRRTSRRVRVCCIWQRFGIGWRGSTAVCVQYNLKLRIERRKINLDYPAASITLMGLDVLGGDIPSLSVVKAKARRFINKYKAYSRSLHENLVKGFDFNRYGIE